MIPKTQQEGMKRFTTGITEVPGKAGHSSQAGLKWFESAREGGRPGFTVVRRWCQGESSHVAGVSWFESPAGTKGRNAQDFLSTCPDVRHKRQREG